MEAPISAIRRFSALAVAAVLLAILVPAGAMATQLDPSGRHLAARAAGPEDADCNYAPPGMIKSAKLVIGTKKVTKLSRGQVGKVKLSVRFSPKSEEFYYWVHLMKNGKWAKVSQKKKIDACGTASFSRNGANRTLTLRSLFGGKAVKAGSYRLSLASDTYDRSDKSTLTFVLFSVR